MAQSFAALHCHLVFSTKERRADLVDTVRARTVEYLGGLCRSRQSPLIIGDGTADHLHLLVSLGREIALATLLREIKATSSKWIHETFPQLSGFAWQDGYGAFAVSHSNLGQVRAYIQAQDQHHRRRTFQEELIELLKRHEIQFDERYLWR